jgi:hypothetical protein
MFYFVLYTFEHCNIDTLWVPNFGARTRPVWVQVEKKSCPCASMRT